MSEGRGLYKGCDRLIVGTMDREDKGILFAGDASEVSRVQTSRHLTSFKSRRRPRSHSKSDYSIASYCGPFRNLGIPCPHTRRQSQFPNGPTGSLCAILNFPI
jgi:hypothetical protein